MNVKSPQVNFERFDLKHSLEFPSSAADSTKKELGDGPQTTFSNQEVQAAIAWKHGRLAAYIYIESVWPLLDEYRAHLAGVRATEAKR